MTQRIAALTDLDLAQLSAHGLSPETAERQLHLLRQPPPPVVLDRPATVGDGIVRLDASAHPPLLELGDGAAAAGRVSKFVPASGAATRMFKDLITAYEAAGRPSAFTAAREFFQQLDHLPFAEELRHLSGVTGVPSSEAAERRVLAAMLEDMRYAVLPKALIPFHRADHVRTALEEHLLEATRYACARDGRCRVHFTVSPEFRETFQSTVVVLGARIETHRSDARLDVTLSEQHPSTDALAIDAQGEPFRTSDGALLIRPAGHGALLKNLHECGGDVVAIKNIDNVVPDEISSEVVWWKRLLIGYLVRLEAAVFEHLSACAPPTSTESDLDAAMTFASLTFARRPLPSATVDRESKRRFVIDALDRPLRVCGVVRNEGEPGGAPFWVIDQDGSRSVQIVESSQVAMNDPAQARLFRRSTHFNPVDIVCALRSVRGDRHNLERFVDERMSFVTRKSFEGRELTALEQPGLWNGAMAGWNTVCVEVPAATFAPVKTVFDLLRPQHQARRAAQVSQSHDAFSEDLRAAADVQKGLLPKASHPTPGLSIASMFHPSLAGGGDIFNLIPLAGGLVGAFIADVSGHGVTSALLTLSLSQWLASEAGLQRPGGVPSLTTVLDDLEREYPFERFDKYFSIVIAIINPTDGELRYTVAGHPAPLLIRRSGEVCHLTAGGPIVGMGFGLPFEEGIERLSHSDRLVFFTDGVTGDMSGAGEPFGLNNLIQTFIEGRDRPLGDLCAELDEQLARRRGDVPALDDIALLAMERH